MTLNPETSSTSAQAPSDSQSILDQLSEIQDEAKKNKVQLAPEVEAYIREHLEIVQQKYANNEPVYEEDLEFIKDVRLWVSLQDNVRQMFPTIESMNKEATDEAVKRHISPKQWLDLLHVAEAARKDKKWIDETFRFPGGGRIETDMIYLNTCTSLKSLPAGLKVRGSINLKNCTSLSTLPAGLKAGRIMDLGGCTSLSTLPAGLKVKGVLVLGGCTSLISLPADLEVGYNLYLPRNLQLQVIKDAERLKREGKIKGEIIYHNYNY